MRKRYAVYFSDAGWTCSTELPWDSRPIAENEWAASAAAVWANQQLVMLRDSVAPCPTPRHSLLSEMNMYRAFLRVAVAAIPRVAEIICRFPRDDRAGALERG
jgi:hypothetical protein